MTSVPSRAANTPSPPLQDLAPLAWVMDELRRTLDDAVHAVRQFVHDQVTARETDLSEVDGTSLRMVRQQIHQAAGALDMVGLGAAAQTLRSLETVTQRLLQKPAMATPELTDRLAGGAHALLEYLQRHLRQKPVPDLALFPTYADWQQLGGAARAHPADLWEQVPVDVVPPPGKVFEPGPAVRAHLDRLVLHVVKALNPQAAASLAQLAAGLSRGAKDGDNRRFWLAAAAYFEAVAQRRLPETVYVKRAASSVLLQYAHGLQGDTQSLASHTHDLLYLTSRVRPDPDDPAQACLRAIWAAHGWSELSPWDAEARVLGRFDPAALEALRASGQNVQRLWALWCEGDRSGAVGDWPEPLRGWAEGLAALLPEMASLQRLSAAWRAVASVCEAGADRLPEGLALEVSSSLLLIGAELDDLDPLDVEAPVRHDRLAERLTDAMQGHAVPEPDRWMTERYQRLGEQETLSHLTAQWRADLDAVEQALDGLFRSPSLDQLAGLDTVVRRLDASRGIATLLDLPAARRTLEWLRDELATHVGATVVPGADALAEAAGRWGPNVTALGWLIDTFARQPLAARERFVFDESTGRLMSSWMPADAPGHLEPEPSPPPVDQAASASRSAEPVDPEDDDDAELLSIFLDEAQGVFEQATATLQVLRDRPASLPDLTALRRGFHTLKGSARMVGLVDLGDAAWAMEQLLNTWLAEQRPASSELLALSTDSLSLIQAWVDRLRSGVSEAQAGDSRSIRASADAMRLEGRWLPLVQPAAESTVPDALPVLEDVVETVVPVLDEAIKVVGPLRIDLDLYNVFLHEADEWSRRLGQTLSEWRLMPHEEMPPEAAALAHSMAGGAATVGHQGLSQLARALEHAIDRLRAIGPAPWAVDVVQADVLVGAAEEIRHVLHQFAAGFLRDPAPSTIEALRDMVFRPLGSMPPEPAGGQPAVEPTASASAPVDAPLVDHLDADLFAVFEDEAQELLPRLSSALRQWAARPDNDGARAEVLRTLHTFKGSARLAGALLLGDMAHRLESDVLALPDLPDASQVLPLQSTLDQLVARFERLRRAFAQPAVTPEPPVSETSIRVQAPEGLPPPVVPVLPEPAVASQTTVRVRADVLDQVMTQVGDVVISRARLEGDLRSLRQSFKDMSGNIERLRSQLRDLELQTEMQMQSRLAQSRETDARFDPLEFDRYTRVQELTRLLAESVNDVATVQHHLQRSVEAAEGNIAAQARQTRELQRDLLRTRLVAFDTLSERLHRLVRQAADAEGKDVALFIGQGHVEVDRAVLERLTPVLEHLLRNAVVHGMDAPDRRRAAAKSPTGRIELVLEPRGNDLSLTLSDDGRGLDVARIRERAIALRLHPADRDFQEEDAARCIFASGVSTASEVTEVAGRGIGLDVVRNEVLALGGRIEYFRPEGGGTAFRLVVPLSTAVTQVVMLRVGDFVFGVPAPWVAQVNRAQAPELTAAYLSGQWKAGDEVMPFHWAGALLALSVESDDPTAHDARSWPVLEFYSAGQRVAWHVDEVLGHQEAVVKPMGPQLSRLPGLAGATILASGAVALIYNPVALSSLYGEAARQWVRAQRALGADVATARRVATRQEGAMLAPLVLVVDDSITVRRVTQRLLKREGYRVALAADGVQALERLQEELPVVVLCDIEMPRMDGFELVERMRQDAATTDLPVVMITSRLADKHRDHAQNLGVDHYLGKPYAEDELLALVAGYARLAPRSPRG